MIIKISWSRKQWLEFIGIFLVAGVLIWFGQKWYMNLRQITSKSHQFVAQIVSVDNNTIQALGYHVLDLNPDKSDFKQSQTVTVKFNERTKFVKTTWYMLSKDYLVKTNGKYDPSMVGKKQSISSVDEFKEDKPLAITVHTLKNSFNDKDLMASEIDYNTRVYDQLPPKK